MKIPRYQLFLCERITRNALKMGFEYEMNTPFFGAQIYVNYKTGAVLMVRFDDYRFDYPNGRQSVQILTACTYIDRDGIVHHFSSEFNRKMQA